MKTWTAGRMLNRMRDENEGTYRGERREDTCDHGLSRGSLSYEGKYNCSRVEMESKKQLYEKKKTREMDARFWEDCNGHTVTFSGCRVLGEMPDLRCKVSKDTRVTPWHIIRVHHSCRFVHFALTQLALLRLHYLSFHINSNCSSVFSEDVSAI